MSHNFNYFLNKFCTIIVPAINRKYSEDQNNAYFLGKVLSINGDGVLIEHPSTKCKTFFNMNNIICIAEEVVLTGEKQQNLIDPKIT